MMVPLVSTSDLTSLWIKSETVSGGSRKKTYVKYRNFLDGSFSLRIQILGLYL